VIESHRAKARVLEKWIEVHDRVGRANGRGVAERRGIGNVH
jgi:hypothetical protein